MLIEKSGVVLAGVRSEKSNQSKGEDDEFCEPWQKFQNDKIYGTSLEKDIA